VLVLLAGCASPAQQQLTIAGVKAQAQYIQQAQPAVEAYCDALAAAGYSERANQLRVDTRVLAERLTIDGQVRLDALSTENQAIDAAKKALEVADAVLEVYEQGQSTTAPASDTESWQKALQIIRAVLDVYAAPQAAEKGRDANVAGTTTQPAD
jgi:hypothetical protein